MSPEASKRETVLVLCRATPEDSTKYGKTVCVAGLTDRDEFRRLYPVPFKPFLRGGGIRFRKRQWIEAALSPPDDKKDKRTESRKIDMRSVILRRMEDYPDVRKRILRLLAPSIGYIESRGASLGFIRPRLLDFDFSVIEEKPGGEQLQFDSQGFLVEGMKVKLPQRSRYLFTCENPSGCGCNDKPHHMQILDWEVNELFRSEKHEGRRGDWTEDATEDVRLDEEP